MEKTETLQTYMKSYRVELVKQYLDTFKTAGNLPEQQRMMEDLHLLSLFIENGELHKIEKHEKGRSQGLR